MHVDLFSNEFGSAGLRLLRFVEFVECVMPRQGVR